MSTDTPKTDAEAYAPFTSYPDEMVVSVGCSRKLERDLAAANARADAIWRDALEEAAKVVDLYHADDPETVSQCGYRYALANAIRALINAAPRESADSVKSTPEESHVSAAPNTAAAVSGPTGSEVADVDSRKVESATGVEDTRFATPPSAVSMPELPPEPSFKTLRSGFYGNADGSQEPIYSQYCMRGDYDALRAVAEQCRAGWVAERHELMIRTDNYQYQRQRAERAEKRFKWLKDKHAKALSHVASLVDRLEVSEDQLAALQRPIDEAVAALYGAREVCGNIGNIQHAIDLLAAARAGKETP